MLWIRLRGPLEIVDGLFCFALLSMDPLFCEGANLTVSLPIPNAEGFRPEEKPRNRTAVCTGFG